MLANALDSGNYSFSPTNGGSFTTFDGVQGARLLDSTGGVVYLTALSSGIVSVTPGETLDWSIAVRKSSADITGNFIVNLMKTTSNGGSATNNLVLNQTAANYSTDWVTYSGTFTVPAGMEYMRPRVYRSNVGAGSSGAYEIKDFVVTRTVKSGVYLTSPNNTKYRLVVADDGTLGTEAV